MRYLRLSVFPSFVVVLLLAAVGCGGGTDGSGIKTYEGHISENNGQSLADVLVTIESTGDSGVSDKDGNFQFRSDAEGPEVPFVLQSSRFTSRFLVRDIPAESSRVRLELIVDPQTSVTEVRQLHVRAWFAGLCDHYFENGAVIRQANRVPEGTECSINVRVFGDGQPLASVPVALQYSACTPGAQWETLVTASTGDGQHQGYAEVNFSFVDSPQFCRYRIVAPYQIEGISPVAYPIDTFSEQKYFNSN